jgi:PKHD-type hydroxylase
LQVALADADWRDGKATAGRQSADVKANRQLDAADPLAQRWGQTIGTALARHNGFVAAALPRRLSAVLFSSYRPGEQYGLHIDNAVRLDGGGPLRADVAATLFLSDPASYDGGELVIETGYGTSAFKLPAGQMLVYPATTLHRVAPVTRGARVAAVFWAQSMVRSDADRELLLDLDRSVQALSAALGANHAQVLSLARTYHNLLRRWAEV